MIPRKTLRQRELELQALMVTPAGREELFALGARYGAASGKTRPEHASVITWILVHERVHGLLGG
jgi:hypothetical protein